MWIFVLDIYSQLKWMLRATHTCAPGAIAGKEIGARSKPVDDLAIW